jgi:hypothetical protein
MNQKALLLNKLSRSFDEQRLEPLEAEQRRLVWPYVLCAFGIACWLLSRFV